MPMCKTTIGLTLIGPWFLSFIQSATLDLNVGAYFEINTTNRGWNSAGVWPAVQLAVDHVNERDDVLPGYNLKLNVKDSRCSDAYAIKALIEHLSDPLTFIALFGPGCALATEPVASVARFWNLIQISYSAGSPRLSDKTRYPTVFRLNSDETKFNEGIVALLKHFKWNKVAVVKQDEAMFNDVNEVLQAVFKKENITLLASNSFVDNPDNVIKDLKEKDARIIITLMYEDRCRRLMCSAYKNGFHGHHRVWFLRGWYTASWWNKAEKDVNCTAEQIKLAAGSYLATEAIIFSDVPDKPTVAGWTASQLRQLYKASLRNKSQEENSYAPYGYDSIWFLALALNQTMTLLTKHNLSLHNFTYKGQQSRIIKESLNQSLLETRFIGMSGDVGFSEKGERKNKIWIEQMQGTKEVRVGTFSSENSSMEIISNRSFKWPDGKGVPSDHRIMIEKREKVSLLLFIILVLMSSLGIIMAISFLIFNIRNRTSSLIKMSSPNINNIMAVGCIMCYACVFLLGADSLLDHDSQITTHSTLCKARLWVMSVGFTMAYGAMFVKTWRVYRIFTNTNMKKELGRLHDRHLIGILAALVIWDLLYLSVWQSISPLTTESKMVGVLMPKDEINVRHFVWVCNCEHIGTWTACLCAYKGLLLAIGVFLAWETRNVNYPALNDSRQIGISVYNVVLCSSIAILLDFALKQRTSVNTSFVLSGTLVNICISFSLGLLFLTKIHALRFKPTVHVQDDQPPTIPTQSTSRPHPNCPACKCE